MTRADEAATTPPPPPPEKTAAEEDPDLPAESFYVSVTDEIDWIDRNAVYERDDSTKGTTNPKSHQHNNNSGNATNTSTSNSQRFSGNLNLKALGLPNISHAPRRASPRPKHKTRTKSFAKSSESDGVSEPVSPKVSCIGRVMSKKERRRRCNRSRQDPPAHGFWLCCCYGR